MRDFDAIFDQLAADPKMASDLESRAARGNESAERRIRNQRRGANRVGSFLVIVIVIARDDSLFSIRLLRRHDREAVRRMSEKYMSNLFHQRSAVSLLAVGRIENHQPPSVRQGPRAGTAGPFVSRISEQVCARLGRQALDAVKVHDEQPGKLCERKWIERLIRLDAGEIAQAQSPQLKMFSLFAGRQEQALHGAL